LHLGIIGYELGISFHKGDLIISYTSIKKQILKNTNKHHYARYYKCIFHIHDKPLRKKWIVKTGNFNALNHIVAYYRAVYIFKIADLGFIVRD